MQMVRLALRAGLIARRRQLADGFKIQLPPLPPAGSREEHDELLRDLLNIAPDWHQQVA